jgi:tRNA-dihydrouridine synthase A
MLDERLSIAPMMEWTDPHYRMLMRGLTKKTVLYTEMVVDETVMYAPRANLDFFIGHSIEEHPSVLQLGGHDPEMLGKATEICSQYLGDYGEINLNCGCPSQRVARRCFGAKLMLEPDLVRQLVYSMQRSSSVPITVKCRIGADNLDKYEDLTHFIRSAHDGGAKKFIIHSRKCFLNGLSTKQNRDIPPLKYEVVHRLVRDFPELTFVLNGGIQTLEEGLDHMKEYRFDDLENGVVETLPSVHGVMIGRMAYNNPVAFATADSQYYGVRDPCLSRRQVLERYMDYCDWCQENGPRKDVKGRTQIVTTSILLNSMRNVIAGIRHVNKFRKALNDEYLDRIRGVNGTPNPSPRDIIENSLGVLQDEELDAPLGNADFYKNEIV